MIFYNIYINIRHFYTAEFIKDISNFSLFVVFSFKHNSVQQPETSLYNSFFRC